jgi:PhnB protein
LKGTTVVIGLVVDDPDAVMKRAVAAGGREITAMKDYDYGYRQGLLSDPASHHWLIQKKI